MSAESRRNGTTVTPAAASCAISASTIRFSPEGAAERYRLWATTTFTGADATTAGVGCRRRRPGSEVAAAVHRYARGGDAAQMHLAGEADERTDQQLGTVEDK